MDNGDIDNCPFSIHNIAKLGRVVGRNPGEWYGP